MDLKYFKLESSGNNFILLDFINTEINQFDKISNFIFKEKAVKSSDGLLVINNSQSCDFDLNFLNKLLTKLIPAFSSISMNATMDFCIINCSTMLAPIPDAPPVNKKTSSNLLKFQINLIINNIDITAVICGRVILKNF